MTGSRPARYYEELEQRLRGLDPLVADLVPDLVGWYREYLDVGEYGLAVEIVAERLSADMPADRVRGLAAGLLPEAERMGLEEIVDRLRTLV